MCQIWFPLLDQVRSFLHLDLTRLPPTSAMIGSYTSCGLCWITSEAVAHPSHGAGMHCQCKQCLQLTPAERFLMCPLVRQVRAPAACLWQLQSQQVSVSAACHGHQMTVGLAAAAAAAALVGHPMSGPLSRKLCPTHQHACRARQAMKLAAQHILVMTASALQMACLLLPRNFTRESTLHNGR